MFVSSCDVLVGEQLHTYLHENWCALLRITTMYAPALYVIKCLVTCALYVSLSGVMQDRVLTHVSSHSGV